MNISNAFFQTIFIHLKIFLLKRHEILKIKLKQTTSNI